MNPAVSLLRLRQGNGAIEDYVVMFLELSNQVDFNEVALKDIFRVGLNEPIRSGLPGGKIHFSLAEYIYCALLISGSSFTVGVVEEEHDTSTRPAQLMPAKPQPAIITPAAPGSAHVTPPAAPGPAIVTTPAAPGSAHVTPPAAPGSAHVTPPAAPGPAHVMPAAPEPAHVMPAAPEPAHVMPATPEPAPPWPPALPAPPRPPALPAPPWPPALPAPPLPHAPGPVPFHRPGPPSCPLDYVCSASSPPPSLIFFILFLFCLGIRSRP